MTRGEIYCQTIEQITPMHLFLQKNADSTIIYKKESSWLEPPVYFMISKKQNTISLYTYKSLYRNKIKIPTHIRDTINKIKNYSDYSQSYNVSINKFFDAKYINDESAEIFWTSLNQLKPWGINDDKKDGAACKEYTADKYVSDLGGISLFLITKTDVKSLYFYRPKFFEEKVCPTRVGRQSILEIERLFLEVFKD